jgi:hypothetical protein
MKDSQFKNINVTESPLMPDPGISNNDIITSGFLDDLMKPEKQYDELPYELRKKRKRKGKR